MINITCTAREGTSKGNVRRLRRNGSLPIVVYSKGQMAQSGTVLKADIEAAMRSIRPGFLTTTVFVLKDETGSERNVLVKEVQYKSTTYDLVHLDFFELEEGRKIDVKVPVEFDNAAECVGVKLGGQLRHIMRHVKVRCEPANIPSHFSVDVKDLAMHQTKRVRDIAIPPFVTCLAHANDVIVAVLK
jgi:large subunit ribosomal protein L25